MNRLSAAIGSTVAVAAAVCIGHGAAAHEQPAPVNAQAASQMSATDANLWGDRAVRAQDYAGALRWYRFAADQGNALAEAHVGYFYQLGIGIAPDYARAAHWYRLAADKGSPIAESQLGYLYEHGLGVKQDKAEATRWYHKASDHGWPQHGHLFVAAAWGWLEQQEQAQAPDETRGAPPQPETGVRGVVETRRR